MQIKYEINNLQELDSVMDLAKLIFNPSEEELKLYHNKSDWKEKILNDGLLISAKLEDSIVGFTICYVKDYVTLHIWNVGIKDKYRGNGIWRKMFRILLEYASLKNFKHVTLNTYKENFPSMYKFALKNMNEYKTTKVEIAGEVRVKSLFKKDLF